jgi:DtxR family transcriptional regulator, Mn-dependent transcriptional regulator
MTFSEENYLKSIYHLTASLETEVSTNAIAEMMETKASSVTDMLKKLADKDLVNYKKYQGVSLTVKRKTGCQDDCSKTSFVGSFFGGETKL